MYKYISALIHSLYLIGNVKSNNIEKANDNNNKKKRKQKRENATVHKVCADRYQLVAALFLKLSLTNKYPFRLRSML